MELLCTNPQIIKNPLLEELYYKSAVVFLNGEVYKIDRFKKQRSLMYFPYNLFSKDRCRVTVENIDNFYLVDSLTGECYPVFIQVTCNKCRVCKNRKSNDLTARFLAETSTSVGKLLFIRLSYNDYVLPFDAFSKRHCQLFLKRLRIKLERFGHKVNLRYFLISEYGGTYGRPHYHLLLWNFPTWEYSYFATEAIIRDCWSETIDEETYNDIKSNFSKHYVYSKNVKKWNIGKRTYETKKEYRLRYGFIRVDYYQKRGKSSKAGFEYITKYMRKEQGLHAHELDNPTFTLSSRRGGLGSEWLEQNKDFYHKNPEVLDMEVIVPFEEKPVKCMLPKFFREKLFPSRSRLIPKKIRDLHKRYVQLFNIEQSILYHFNKIEQYKLDEDINIQKKYHMLPFYEYDSTNGYWLKILINRFLPQHKKYTLDKRIVTVINPYTGETMQTESYCNKPMYRNTIGKHYMNNEFLSRITNVIVWYKQKIYKQLMAYEIPMDWENLQVMRAHHENAMNDYITAQPPIDVTAYDEYLQRNEVRQMHRECHTNDEQ